MGDASLTSACTGGDCSSGTSGEVKSPNYPSKYDNNKHVSFPLEVASGSAIELTFTDIDIEPHGSCDYDYVQVLNTDNSQLVKACGTTKPVVLKSTGNKMTVVFHSDGSVVHKGFSATWKSVEAAAMPTSGEIKSPNTRRSTRTTSTRRSTRLLWPPARRWSCPLWTWRSRRTGQRALTTTSRPTTHLLGDLRP